MRNLIDREELMKKLKTSRLCNADTYRDLSIFRRCENIVMEQPKVEAVVVVRCKDCKHSTLPAALTIKYGKQGALTCHNRLSPCNRRNVIESDFCSYAEKKEGVLHESI